MKKNWQTAPKSATSPEQAGRKAFAAPFVLLAYLLFAFQAGAVTGSACFDAARMASRSTGVPFDILQALTLAETGQPDKRGELMPSPWAVNVGGKGYWFAGKEAALEFVRGIRAEGIRNFDVGCFQLNYRWHGAGFGSLEDMFDPHRNATYAARFIGALYEEKQSWAEAAGAYHSRTPELASRYAGRFEAIRARLAGRSQGVEASRKRLEIRPAEAGSPGFFFVARSVPSTIGSRAPGSLFSAPMADRPFVAGQARRPWF